MRSWPFRTRWLMPAGVAALLAGCSVLGLGRPTVDISLYPDVPVPGHVLRVRMADETFRVQAGNEARVTYAREHRAPRTGRLNVTAALLSPTGAVLAQTSFEQEYSTGYDHWVAAHITVRRPVGICLGTLVPVPIEPILAAGADTMFVMYGRIPEDAVC